MHRSIREADSSYRGLTTVFQSAPRCVLVGPSPMRGSSSQIETTVVFGLQSRRWRGNLKYRGEEMDVEQALAKNEHDQRELKLEIEEVSRLRTYLQDEGKILAQAADVCRYAACR